jgi:hypothetical protein
MNYPFWRLSEAGPDNLGLTCTDDGLLLGQTPLIERQGGRFVAREREEIARLLMGVFPDGFTVERLMPGLATVASALNANDPALARIAAVHLRIPDLPSAAARDAMIAEDVLIKYARDEGGGGDWNPALHPRTGAPPNSGWFAPTDGSGAETSRVRVAENQRDARRSDVAGADGWVRLPPREDRIDELADFLEWLANAKPQDEKAIRHEIKRYFYDAGERIGGDQLSLALRSAIDAGDDRQARQEILNDIERLSRADPAVVGWHESLFYLGLSVFLPGGPPKVPRAAPKSPSLPKDNPVASSPPDLSSIAELAPKYTPLEIWNLGVTKRGQLIHEIFGDGSLPPLFRTIDKFDFATGAATSIKSIDVRALTYQDASRFGYRVNDYVNRLSEYEGGALQNVKVNLSEITDRILEIIVPKGGLTETQQAMIEAARVRAQTAGSYPVRINIKEF